MFFEKARWFLEVRRRIHAAPELRLVIDEIAAAWPFTEAAVNGSGIRSELESHRRGAHGACTQAASAFLFALAADPLATRKQYLQTYRARCRRLPACNEREPSP